MFREDHGLEDPAELGHYDIRVLLQPVTLRA